MCTCYTPLRLTRQQQGGQHLQLSVHALHTGHLHKKLHTEAVKLGSRVACMRGFACMQRDACGGMHAEVLPRVADAQPVV
jgi:hypothetical protein